MTRLVDLSKERCAAKRQTNPANKIAYASTIVFPLLGLDVTRRVRYNFSCPFTFSEVQALYGLIFHVEIKALIKAFFSYVIVDLFIYPGLPTRSYMDRWTELLLVSRTGGTNYVTLRIKPSISPPLPRRHFGTPDGSVAAMKPGPGKFIYNY